MDFSWIWNVPATAGRSKLKSRLSVSIEDLQSYSYESEQKMHIIVGSNKVQIRTKRIFQPFDSEF